MLDGQDEDQEQELLLTDEVDEGGAVEAEPQAEAAQAEEDEFAIEIDGDEPAAEETPLIKELRGELRAAQKELSERRKAEMPKIEVGKEPDLWEDCDGDPDKYKTELLAYEDRKRKAADQDKDAEQAAAVRNQEYQRRFVNYRAKAASLPVKDFDEAEKSVIGTLPELLQSAIVAYAEDPAKVVYALAKHPAKLNALSQESDPIKFVLAMRDMERSLKVVNKRKPPAPEAETIQSGSAQSPKADKQAEKLLAEAQRPGGSMTAYNRYMKSKRAA